VRFLPRFRLGGGHNYKFRSPRYDVKRVEKGNKLAAGLSSIRVPKHTPSRAVPTQVAMADNRPPAMFLADALGLDFLNSIATPQDTEIEWLATGEDLLAWLEQAKLVSTDAAGAIRAIAFPGELDAVAAQARALREWFRAFVLTHKGKRLTTNVLKQLTPLNNVLERDEAFKTIVARCNKNYPTDRDHVSGLELLARRRWRTPASLLVPIGHAMAELVCSADFSLVKKCERPTCTLVFLDTTQGQTRRWCSMASCGNRAKQEAHRKRSKRLERE
jgi:predicted RNA-binding Zn ribbon-like protein